MAVNLMSEDTYQKIMLQVDLSWHNFMRRVMIDAKFTEILAKVVMDRTKLAPKPNQLFRVLRMPIEKIRVVILGQDPYIKGEAHGLAFSSQLGITPSLREIFKEIARTEGKLRTKFSLEDWESQGVFLINTNLSTTIGKSLAHDKVGWQWFTGLVLKEISDRAPDPIVVMAWGNHAKKMVKDHMKAGGPNRHALLQHTHPAARFQEFTGCDHFKLANQYLKVYGFPPIDWAGPEFKPVLQPDFNDGKEIPGLQGPGDLNESSETVGGSES